MRIVLTTIGTLGDLHPYIALGRGLIARGHQAIVATHAGYRERVEREGVAFHPIRPDLLAVENVEELFARAMDARTGSEFVARKLVLPYLRETCEDLLAAATGAAVLVGHPLAFAAPIVAERLGIPRVHVALQPFTMFSTLDPPLTPLLPRWVYRLGPGVWRTFWNLGRLSTRGWFRDVETLRREHGLAPTPAHPLFDAWSPVLNLALFSAVLAPRQPDWPPHTVVTGFPVDPRERSTLPLPLDDFLDRGPAPIVFTLGSSAVWVASGFYAEAAKALEMLGARGVLLVGDDPRNLGFALPGDVLALPYARHEELFPRARLIVHHGGVGTTGHALRSGNPALVVPFSHDQPDNAMRCARLGVARVLPRGDVHADRLARTLRAMLDDSTMRRLAAEVGARVRAEPGVAAAVEAIEGLGRTD